VRRLPNEDAEDNRHLPAATPKEARDKWIYDEAMKGTPWRTIVEKLV